MQFNVANYFFSMKAYSSRPCGVSANVSNKDSCQDS